MAKQASGALNRVSALCALFTLLARWDTFNALKRFGCRTLWRL